MSTGSARFTDKPLFGDIWVSYAVLLAWVVIAYGLLAWRLARRES